MNQKSYSCPGCGKSVNEFDIKGHINKCQKYDAFCLHKIKKLDQRQEYGFLKFLSQQLSIARSHLESVLNRKKQMQQGDDGFEDILQMASQNNMKPQQQPPKQFVPAGYKSQFMEQETEKPKKNLSMIEEPKMGRMPQQQMKMGRNSSDNRMMDEQEEILIFDERDMVRCANCNKTFYSSYDVDKFLYIEECWHLVCKLCILKYLDNEFVNSGGFPKCPLKDCTNIIQQHQTRAILGQKYEVLQNKAFRKMYNIVECVKCKSSYDFQAGNPNDAPKKTEQGQLLKPEHAILYAQNRFICPRPDCKTQQCKQCQAIPYHLGMNCKQFEARSLMKKCRYCDTPITQKNTVKNSIPAHQDICNSKDCQSMAANACTKILPCNHPCSGVKGEKNCLPCLKQSCCEKAQNLMGQTGDDYCSICYIESLSSAPSIQCGCGHIFHLKCIKKRFQIKWLTPRILFNFCLCPLCKKWIDVPPENELFKLVSEMRQLYEKIQKMSIQRLKFQECDKDQKLTKKDSPYYNKPNEYAMAIYAYFLCFKCQRPYFGGRKNCAEVMNSEQNVQGFNAKELVCPQCCDVPVENCPKHGNDFIEFKCKFCCSTAQWFCWGNTHFCEPCHKKQCNGEYVSKYTKDQLPKCQGPGKCPIGGNHGQNGEQKMLGCAICRNYKQNSKSF